MVSEQIPKLTGDAHNAVTHRGSHLQIIACAGSGKTEAVAQRVADLFATGISPESVVAFTFTNRAAEELKRRVEQRVEARIGTPFVDQLNGCFIGTIHSYCLQLLQQNIAKYESYDVLDNHQLAAFLTREHRKIGFKDLTGRMFSSIGEFVRNVDVVDNELIPIGDLSPPFRQFVERFRRQLDRYRLLTHGQTISLAVHELGKPQVLSQIHSKLKHLIVDEYQDVNPAQEALVRILSRSPVNLCVVGDDDQCIYQWRGSDVGNIVTFEKRYKDVQTFTITTNRRSRPRIIEMANEFACTIKGRLPKEMQCHRDGAAIETVTWKAATETEEADVVARTIKDMHEIGYRYCDIAILVRSSTSYKRLVEALDTYSIPVQPGGRTGLFLETEAQIFGKTIAYLAGHEWRPQKFGGGEVVDLNNLLDEYVNEFELSEKQKRLVHAHISQWKQEVAQPTKPTDLIGDFYDLLALCGVANWDLSDSSTVARLGSLARCSAILADYESIRRRSRPDDKVAGEAVGGQDRGEWYFKWLAIHIQNWALGVFEGFEGEEDITLDAVDLTTIHKSKGLEWPVVFIPCVSAKRFPSSKTGQTQNWHVPAQGFDRTRYEGTENDERRLFYVAMTRARDWVSISTHDTPSKQTVAPSRFLLDVAKGAPDCVDKVPLPQKPAQTAKSDELLAITFSELASFKSCGLAFRLRHLIGFKPSLSTELGFGQAIHHLMRQVAEHTQRHHNPPSSKQLDLLFDEHFYLPAANKVGHRQMKAAAQKLVQQYISGYAEDLRRVWAVERPVELHLPNAVVSGRVDAILEEEGNSNSALTIIDYKTAANDNFNHDEQLQFYADAGRREGLDVRAAYVHDLKSGKRIEVDISSAKIEEAEANVVSLVDRLRAREFEANPGSLCRECDVQAICQYADGAPKTGK